MPKARRLDQELVHRGLFDSREKAQRAIMAGEIRVNGQLCDKASHSCPEDALIERDGGDQYVGRGGHKLAAALDHFKIDPAGLRCLDIGSSTGGFTDCLLQRGAALVVCIDVGQGQLHWKIRQDPRVEVREGINARHLKPADFGPGFVPFPLIVADVSFISLRLVLPAVFDLLASPGRICALIKPQFEAGREQVGKGGIVRDESVRDRVVSDLQNWLRDYPMRTDGVLPSPLLGGDGNQEYLWHLEKK
jgi:23S rRNA (cytidine1920-2'-O)/16S rRNA (cytidine1409-2'-O)-methyltransferase